MTRVVIPVAASDGAHLAEHFGRAPYFAVIEVNGDGSVVSKDVRPNRGEHAGGRGHAHDNILQYTPNVIVVHGMGPRGLRSFQSKNIAVLKASSTSVAEVLRSYIDGALQELTDGCADAHHR